MSSFLFALILGESSKIRSRKAIFVSQGPQAYHVQFPSDTLLARGQIIMSTVKMLSPFETARISTLDTDTCSGLD